MKLLSNIAILAYVITIISCGKNTHEVRVMTGTNTEYHSKELICHSKRGYSECDTNVPVEAINVSIALISGLDCKLDDTYGLVNDQVMFASGDCKGKFTIRYKIIR